MICRFLHNPWSDLSQILKIIYQHIFFSSNKILGQSLHIRMKGDHQPWLCMHRHCMSTFTHDKCSCVHAQERIIQKITLENRIYVGSLSLKYEKDLLHGCGEVCLSLAMHVYLQFFFVFSPIFQVQCAKHTNGSKLRQSIWHFWKPIIKMSQCEWKNDTFSGQYSYF